MSILKRVKNRIKRLIRPNSHAPQLEALVSLNPSGSSRGNVLISFLTEPFLRKDGQSITNEHIRFWQCYQMAQIFLEFGYAVDIIHFENTTFKPKKTYKFCIDTRFKLANLARKLNEDCVKILHIEIPHVLFHNAAECNRLLHLQQRRGITLMPRRYERPTLAFELADCATLRGNEFTSGTYAFAKKPLHCISNSSTVLYDWPEHKDFDGCRRNFLWFASWGMVHKGLDLVLEAFAEMPDYSLTVCGPVTKEKDFVQAFYTELYELPNIRLYGWVDVSSDEFIDLLNNCIALVYPSCSEGQAGSVINCLHAGLIPIMSYESGVDAEDFGVILKDCSLEEIKEKVYEISNLPTSELKQRSRKAWEFARENFSREKFIADYKQFVETLIDTYEK